MTLEVRHSPSILVSCSCLAIISSVDIAEIFSSFSEEISDNIADISGLNTEAFDESLVAKITNVSVLAFLWNNVKLSNYSLETASMRARVETSITVTGFIETGINPLPMTQSNLARTKAHMEFAKDKNNYPLTVCTMPICQTPKLMSQRQFAEEKVHCAEG